MRISIAALAPIVLTAACDAHSVPPPQAPAPDWHVEIGPVMTDQGVDLSPAIAERMRERGLADAHVVEAPSGTASYVDGHVQVSHADRGKSFGLHMASGLSLAFGGLFDLVGVLLVAADATTAGAVSLGIGLPVTTVGAILAAHPSRYMDATLTADLHVVRGGSAKPLQLKDEASVWHDSDEPQVGGGKLLDGIANGISTEAR